MGMNRLVNNLLDMARLESGMLKLNKQWCDMEEIIGTALKRFEANGKDRNLELRCSEVLPLINVDFVLIEQVVVNLLDNALKYSNPQSKIRIDLAKGSHGLTLSVSDFGIPIPEDDLERIFDKFYRVRAPRQVSGTGLGLAISKGIVELHGGRIWAENHSGSTVSISFLLPIETVPKDTDHCIGVLEHEQ
jgi:two-component system sensor histidine kinase KdpD